MGIFNRRVFNPEIFNCRPGVFNGNVFNSRVFNTGRLVPPVAISAAADFSQQPNAMAAAATLPLQEITPAFRVIVEARSISGVLYFEQGLNSQQAAAKLSISGRSGITQSAPGVSGSAELYNTDEETIIAMLMAMA